MHRGGYRWIVSGDDPSPPADGSILEGWDDDWLVVADEGGDPFILSRSTGKVMLAEHGAGVWEPGEIFESVEHMAAVLTSIGNVCAAAGGDLTDDDSYIRPEWRAHLEAEVGDALGERSAGGSMLARLGFG